MLIESLRPSSNPTMLSNAEERRQYPARPSSKADGLTQGHATMPAGILASDRASESVSTIPSHVASENTSCRAARLKAGVSGFSTRWTEREIHYDSDARSYSRGLGR